MKGNVMLPANPKARGGFISVKSKYKANLMDYHGLEIKIKNNLEEVVLFCVFGIVRQLRQ